ncbi:MAG TPA: DUF6625 family protein [Methylomirabilota bacterium]|nr:DUF6625 family protein [Methylomirabilota bacterium]
MPETKTSRPRSSICLIRWWFGEFSPYMDCVLRSCAANPDIDWLLLTDNPSRKNFPPNVRTYLTNRQELHKRFSAKLDFEVNLSRNSLMANFKPAFGFLFDDLLVNYDFWGHCDFDVIFGDLRKFLREDILAAHDRILSRGHLTLYRNTPKVNEYFKLQAPNCRGYRETFSDSIERNFDEWRGMHLLLRYHNIPQFHDEFIVDVVPPTRWKFTRFEGVAIKNYPEQVFYWHQGKVFHAHYNLGDRGIMDDEYAYIHFQGRPMPAPEFDPFAVNGFLITPDGFFPYNREPLTDADFARYNRERWRPRKQILHRLRLALGKRLGLVPWERID